MPSDDLEAALRRIVVQQQLLEERLRALEQGRLLRTWNVLYRKITGWRGGIPDLRTPGDYELLLHREEQLSQAINNSIRFSVAIEGGSEAQRNVSLESVKAQSYTNWELAEQGDYLVTLHPGDRLAPQAFYFYAQALASADFVYADEDSIDAPLFKPDWSPELLRSTTYLGRAVVRKRDTQTSRAVHIPRVLYHRASSAVIERTPPSYTIPPDARLSVIICSREARRVREYVEALRRNTTSSTSLEIIVVHHIQGKRGCEKMPGICIPYSGPFDFARMNNLAAQKASAPALVFLNDDVIVEQRGWDQAFAATLARPEIGAVGAMLDYPDGTIQHAGVVIGMGDGAGHCGRFQTSSDLWPWLRMSRDVTAVTGAMLGIRTDVFQKVNGFDEAFPVNYNDVDLCLRIREAGLSVVCLDAGKIVHRESQTRVGGTRYEEREALYKRWAHVLSKPDEFYSPHLAATERIALRTSTSPLVNLVATR